MANRIAKTTIEVELVIWRCWECARMFGMLDGNFVAGCPYCAGEKLKRTEQYWRNAQDGNAKRNRTIAALHGQITKLKKRLACQKSSGRR